MPSNMLPSELYQLNYDPVDPDQATTCTIYTALDQLVLTQENPLPAGAVPVASHLNHVIYADTVIVRGPLSLPGKNVSIYARVIGSQADSNNNPASIDVSGAPAIATAVTQPKIPKAANGEDGPGGAGSNGSDGSAGADGARGNNGGTITLYMESNFQLGTNIRLVSNGSPGAPGADGQAGQDGGDGGRGRDGVKEAIGYGHTHWQSNGETGGSAGNGGNGGRGGRGGDGGSGGTITTVSVLVADQLTLCDLNLHVSATGGDGGSAGNGGAGGRAGVVGADGLHPEGSPSHPGNDGQSGGSGQNGNASSGGTVRLSSLNDAIEPGQAEDLRALKQQPPPTNPIFAAFSGWISYDDALAATINGINQLLTRGTGTTSEGAITYNDLAQHSSVTQRSMTLQKAKLLYQMACPPDPNNPSAYSNTTAYGQAATLFAWLRNTTSYFATTTPPAPPAGFTADDVSIMASIYNQATALACQLTLKRDFYGQLPSYVPQGSFSFYQAQLSAMLGAQGTFTQIENNYLAYLAALQQQSATSSQFDTAKSNAAAIGVSLQTQRDDARTKANDLPTKINADEDAVEAQERILRNAIHNVENDLARLAGPGCFMDSMLKALNMVTTFTGNSDLKLANTIAGVVNDNALQPGLALAAGVASLPTTNLVKQVDVLGDTVTTLNEGYAVGNGVVTEADPNAYKLLAAQTQLDNILDDYRNKASAREAIDAINLYVSLVQKRNADIMKYNGYVAQIATTQSQIDQNKVQSNKCGAGQEFSTHPSLAPAAAFMARLYHDAREQVIYTIYMASRSCAFWSLNPGYDVFAEFIGLDDPSLITAGSLAIAQQAILNNFQAAVENIGTGSQAFPNTADNPQTSSSATEPQRPFFRLTAADYPGLFEAFKTPIGTGDQQIYQISFPIPAALKDTPETVSPFYGKANVRLGKVRPWIRGATNLDPKDSTNHVLTVAVTHAGAETIVGADNNEHCFTHAPVTKTFAYDYTRLYDSHGITVDEDFNVGDNQGDYAQPGPFTIWTLTLTMSDNSWLDMTNVDEIAIEFGGTFYTFNQ